MYPVLFANFGLSEGYALSEGLLFLCTQVAIEAE